MNPPITDYWAKLERDPDDPDILVAWHPLIHHCADVAAVFESLLHIETINRRIARLAGKERLGVADIERLCFFAAIHDLGKTNHGFNAKAGQSEYGGRAGHVTEALWLISGRAAPDLVEKLFDGLHVEQLWPWFDGDEQKLCTYLSAAIAHHGSPAHLDGCANVNKKVWLPWRGRDPFEGVAELAGAASRWFPAAFGPTESTLPVQAAFHHAFTGLLMLADWIGSDRHPAAFPFSEDGTTADERMEFARTRAPEVLRGLGLENAGARGQLVAAPGFDLIKEDKNFSARALQQEVEALPSTAGASTTILEAETGSGKTEAALIHYLRLFKAGAVDGMYFALPTRTAATQIYTRVCDAVIRAFPDSSCRPPRLLAVPGYLRVDDRVGYRGDGYEVDWERLSSPEVLWDDNERARFRFRGWAAENSKRYLAGSVVVGTIDQVLLSALKVKHAHLRASSLLRHLLVVDEVHASDTYMTTVLREVLSRHRASGGHALLMSATLGGSTRAALLGKSKAPSLEEALATPYPLLTHQVESSEAASERAIRHEGRERSVRVELCSEMQDHSVTARRALVAARAGARVLVLRNTVRACHATQLELEALAGSQEAELLFGVGSVVAPHHSRFAKNDRTALDEAIEKRFGKVRANSSGAVAVATQTVQQSLDLDADLLITDLCPMDVLLQRIGRLHRHERASRPPGFEAPKVIVLVPAERDLAAYLRPKREVRGPRGSGFGLVYEDLRVLQATWEQLIVRGTLEIPKDARALVERSVHPEVLRNLVAERGGLWPEHQQHVLGEEGADRSVAKQNLFRFTDSYDDLSFMRSEDGHIKTRLGEGDRLVHLPQPFTSAFGQSVSALTLPHWLCRELPEDVEPTDFQVDAGVLTFGLGAKRFVYDRLGLREATT